MTERIAGIPPYSSTPPVSMVRKSFPKKKKKQALCTFGFAPGLKLGLVWSGLVFGGRLSYHIPIETKGEVKDCTKKGQPKGVGTMITFRVVKESLSFSSS